MRHFSKRIRKNSILIKGLSLILIISFIAWASYIINPKFIEWLDFSQTWCKNPESDDKLSCGEESIFTAQKFPDFKQGNFQKAVNFFEKERSNNQNDPEILIYLNNAKLMQRGGKSYTIAIVVPINQDARGTAEALLRGAAQVQEDFNKNLKYPGLKILVVNDENKPETVKKLAEHLLSKDDVVAVIGHYTSEATKAALRVYQQNKVVVIAPATAAREAILDSQKYPQNFLFRTVPSVKLQFPVLIEQLQLSQLASKEKVAVFYTENSTFSNSAFEEFRNQLGANKIIAQDVSSFNFYARKTLNEVKQQGAKALILIPDGRVSPNSLRNTLSLIDVNEDKLPMAGQTVLYDERILNRINIVKKLSIVIPWHPLSSPNQQVIHRAKQLWGTGNIGVQTAISYDATLVLTKALEKVSISDSLPNQRLAIQQQLNSIQVTGGASGTISFDNVGDRKENTSQIVRVVPVPTKCSIYEAMFVPINYNLNGSDCPQK